MGKCTFTVRNRNSFETFVVLGQSCTEGGIGNLVYILLLDMKTSELTRLCWGLKCGSLIRFQGIGSYETHKSSPSKL